MKRVVILLVFILPVLVFLFLKFFGKNEFDIPVFYQEGVPVGTDCGMKYTAPYIVPDSVMQKMNTHKSVSYIVIDSVITDKELVRLLEKFPVTQIQILNLKFLTESQADFYKRCFFFLKAPNNAVLIDSSRQIRGYYELPELDEMDKLDVELNILLKRY